MLIALNKRNLPVKAWTNNRAYMPIRARYVSDESALRDIARRHLAPKKMYMNDARLLAPFDENEPFEVIFYDGSLCDLLKSLNADAAATMTKKHNNSNNENRKIPSYEFVKKLDNNITYDDYRNIYM
jgi:hypothetical protein